jgi:hypothetical protein
MQIILMCFCITAIAPVRYLFLFQMFQYVFFESVNL